MREDSEVKIRRFSSAAAGFRNKRSPTHGCRISSLTLIFLLTFAGPSFGASPWIAEAGSFDATPIIIYETFDEFYKGGERKDFPFEYFNQITTVMSFDYSVFDGIALDMTIGYVRAWGGTNPMAVRLETNDGLQDVNLGIRFRVLDEFDWDQEWVPSMTLRFGGVIAGTYQADGSVFPGIPGDAANGIEGEFSLGKMLPFYDIGLTGALGVRARDQGTPIDWHLRVGIFKTFFDTVTVGFAYDQLTSVTGLDIGGPGFSPDKFRELKEISKNIEISLGYTDSGGRYYGAYYTKTVGGRNTGIKDVAGFMVTLPFRFEPVKP